MIGTEKIRVPCSAEVLPHQTPTPEKTGFADFTMSKVAPRQAPQRPPRLDSIKNPQPRPPPQAAKAPIRKVQQRRGPKTCPNRDCKEKDVVEEDGLYICRGCGTVVSESNIVSEVTFGETSSGAAVVQGSYVGADQSHARNSMGGNLKRAGGLDSREITDANGRLIQHSWIANGSRMVTD